MQRAIIFIVLLCLATAGCTERRDDERDLRLRLAEYERSWASEQYNSVWEMMSSRLREGNDNDKAKFAQFVRDSGMTIARLELQDIRINGKRATVRVKVTYRSISSGEELGQQVEESQWVKTEGKWLFDSYHALK